MFPTDKQNEINKYYYNEYHYSAELNLSNFEKLDELMIRNSGIHQLDVQKNLLINELNNLRDLMIDDEDLIPEDELFEFLSN